MDLLRWGEVFWNDTEEHTVYFLGHHVTIETLTDPAGFLSVYFSNLPLGEFNHFYKVEYENGYGRWGRGRDEDGEFHQQMFYPNVAQKQGAFPITMMGYYPQQYAPECKSAVETKDASNWGHWECKMFPERPMRFSRCEVCLKFEKKEERLIQILKEKRESK